MSIHKRWDNISYFWTNGVLDTLPDSFSENYTSKKLPKKLKLIAKDFVADILRFFRKSKMPKDKIWFLVLTKNNYDALKDVQSITDNSILASFFRFRSTITEETKYFNLRFRIIWDFVYPISWLIYTTKRFRKGIEFFDLLFAVNGSYFECLRLLKKSKPKGIVFTNDHLIIARSLLLAANRLKIPTFYIPHASVSSYFPPLEFTYALLDGQDAFEKYRQCGPIESEVRLMGMPKFDKYAKDINQSKKVTNIGIAFNMVDHLNDVYGLIRKIMERVSGIAIVLRPHPGETRSLEGIPEGTLVSDSKEEDAFFFLRRIDALISGESSIHLEAVLLNVYPLYFSFTDNNNRFDFYGFIKHGLVENFETTDTIIQKINDLKKTRPDIRYRATYYNAAVGTEFYGRTCEVMSNFIEEKVL